MSKLAMFLVSLLLASCAAFAQDSTQTPPAATAPKHERTHGDRAEQRLKRLNKKLNLTDDQKEKIKPILQDEDKQLTDLESDTTLTPQQKHKKTREIRMSSKSQVEAILTPEQKEKMPSARAHQGRHRTSPATA